MSVSGGRTKPRFAGAIGMAIKELPGCPASAKRTMPSRNGWTGFSRLQPLTRVSSVLSRFGSGLVDGLRNKLDPEHAGIRVFYNNAEGGYVAWFYGSNSRLKFQMRLQGIDRN
jgi:hypothetical protein